MTQKHCPFCKRIMIKDWEKFLEESKEKWIQCNYCNAHIQNPKFIVVHLR